MKNQYEYNGLSKTSSCENLLEDSYEAWYWIGFLMADGHIDGGKIELSLSEKDVDHMKKFAKFIQYTKDLKHLPPRGMGRAQFTMHTSNKLVTEKIREKFNFLHNKTYAPPNFNKINTNDDLFFCLFVGFMDGDGNIGDVKNKKNKYIRIRSHFSWINNLKYFENFLHIYFNKPNRPKYTNIIKNKIGGRLGDPRLAHFRIGKTDLLIDIRDRIKKFNLPIMQRKWEKLNSLTIEGSWWSETEIEQLKNFKAKIIKAFPNRSWGGIEVKLHRI